MDEVPLAYSCVPELQGCPVGTRYSSPSWAPRTSPCLPGHCFVDWLCQARVLLCFQSAEEHCCPAARLADSPALQGVWSSLSSS